MASPSDGIPLSAAQKRKARLRRTAIAKATQATGPDQGSSTDIVYEHASVLHNWSDCNDAGHIQEQLNHLRQMFCGGLNLVDSLQRSLLTSSNERLRADDYTHMLSMGQQHHTPDRSLRSAHSNTHDDVDVVVGSALRADAPPFVPLAVASSSETTTRILDHLSPTQKQCRTVHQSSSSDLNSEFSHCSLALAPPAVTPAGQSVTALEGVLRARDGGRKAHLNADSPQLSAPIDEFYSMAQRAKMNVPYFPDPYPRVLPSTERNADPMLMIEWWPLADSSGKADMERGQTVRALSSLSVLGPFSSDADNYPPDADFPLLLVIRGAGSTYSLSDGSCCIPATFAPDIWHPAQHQQIVVLAWQWRKSTHGFRNNLLVLDWNSYSGRPYCLQTATGRPACASLCAQCRNVIVFNQRSTSWHAAVENAIPKDIAQFKPLFEHICDTCLTCMDANTFISLTAGRDAQLTAANRAAHSTAIAKVRAALVRLGARAASSSSRRSLTRTTQLHQGGTKRSKGKSLTRSKSRRARLQELPPASRGKQ